MINYILLMLLGIFILGYLMPTDSTDKSRFNRSGMSVYVDHKTKVQYVKAGMFGGLTPRLDRDGKPLIEE